MLTIEVTRSRHGRFNAYCEERLLCTSRMPLLTAARVLRDEGVAPSTPIQMRHRGSPTISFASTVGRAADLTVLERDKGLPKFAKHQPMMLSAKVRSMAEPKAGEPSAAASAA